MWLSSDTHVTTLGDPNYEAVYADGATNLQTWIGKANSANPTAAIIAGDLANKSSNMVILAGSYIDSLANCVAVIGNNDLGLPGESTAYYTARKTQCVAEFGMPSSYYSLEYSSCKVIVLDTNFDADDNDSSEESGGHLSAAQLVWLTSEIETELDCVLVFMHHYNPDNLSDLTDILELHSRAILFAGHNHADHATLRLVGTRTEEWIMPSLAIQNLGAIVTLTEVAGNIVVSVLEYNND